MKPRSLHIRFLAIVACAALLLGVSDRALGRHPCPHHDRLPAGENAGSAHADHGAEVPRDSDDAHACTCVGTCAQAATPSFASLRPELPFTPPLDPQTSPRADDEQPQPASRPTVQFANPPPATL